MFGIDSGEFLVTALVALLVIGPKDLPRAMRWVGQWVGKARAMSRHLRAGFDTMMREAELEEMQKVWAAQNEAIMKASALDNPVPDVWAEPPVLPAPEAEPAPEPPARKRKPRAARPAPPADAATPRRRKAKADPA